VDRAFLDGEWLTTLWHPGTSVTVGLRENMEVLTDRLGGSRLAEPTWRPVPPPANHRDPAPQREMTGFTDLTSWDACQAPVCGCLIRDQYPDAIEYQGGDDRHGGRCQRHLHGPGPPLGSGSGSHELDPLMAR